MSDNRTEDSLSDIHLCSKLQTMAKNHLHQTYPPQISIGDHTSGHHGNPRPSYHKSIMGALYT